ncbi:MAG: penicillin-binding protein 2, partial [Demequina sp.]|nr:penicillin-binding protein 2 [Demequina sp.]
DPGATPASQRGSGAVQDVFEPGSTAKTITMAAALEEGIATPTSQFVAPYAYATPYKVFHDSHAHADEKLTLAGVLVTSSNTGTIQIGQQMSDETRYDYLRKFGLGEPTNLGLPNESSGILHPYQDWDPITKYATMFGQGVAVTAVQTAQVYGVVANNGLRISPTIVKGFEDADGTFTPRDNAEPVRVISESTAKALMGMLVEVTEDGTAPKAAIDGYLVAGKTGTAQAPDDNGVLNKVVASFVGIAPADDPRIVISVVMYDPKSSIWGGETAAPVFHDVATFALQTLRVPPTKGEVTRYPTTWE